jgi:hypothetical protein
VKNRNGEFQHIQDSGFRTQASGPNLPAGCL